MVARSFVSFFLTSTADVGFALAAFALAAATCVVQESSAPHTDEAHAFGEAVAASAGDASVPTRSAAVATPATNHRQGRLTIATHATQWAPRSCHSAAEGSLAPA